MSRSEFFGSGLASGRAIPGSLSGPLSGSLSGQSVVSSFLPKVGSRWASNETKKYDVAVIGGGPGGYVAAIRAAQGGKKVVCIESRGSLGGTCLNVGCIPTKALLHATEVYEGTKHGKKYGFKTASSTLDLPALMKGKDATVTGLTKGIEFLFKKNKVDYIKAHATVLNPHQIKLTPANGPPGKAGPKGGAPATVPETVECDNLILATGSTHAELPGGAIKIDEKNFFSSTGALTALKKAPKKMVVIGAGAIGLEFATLFARMGAEEVIVLEFLPSIGGNVDKDVSDALTAALKKNYPAIKVHTNVKVTGAKVHQGPNGDSITVQAVPAQKAGDTLEFETEKVLVAVGRRPFTNNLGLENINVQTDRLGRVPVDGGLRVSGVETSSVYAIGDLVPGPMLAHKAEEDGCFVVEKILGHRKDGEDVDYYDHVPGVIYTDPEVAMVGANEKILKDQKRQYKKGVFPFAANSRAKANQEPAGFVKTLVDPKTNLILGAAIVGNGASELIQQFVMAMKFKLRADDLGNMIFPHPTLSEAVKESCLAATSKAVHM